MKTSNSFEKFLTKKVIFFSTAVILIILCILSSSYALFFDVKETKNDVIKYGDLEVSYSDGTQKIIRENEIPMSDADGMKTKEYTFTISNTGTLTSYITVLLKDESNNNENIDNQIKYSLDGSSGVLVSEIPSSKLIEVKLQPGEKRTYSLRFWLKEDASNDAIGTTFAKSIQVKGEYIPFDYVVNVISLNGLVSTSSKGVSINESVSFELSPSVGYHFDSVECSSNVKGEVSNNVLRVSNVTKNTNCIVNNKENIYYVRYNANGGFGTMNDSTHVYGKSQKLNKNTYTKEGYIFAGWSTSPNGNVMYTDEESVISLTSSNNYVWNLYAVWYK